MKSNKCIFCQVVNKKVEHNQFWEDEHHIAFLDNNPLTFGHTLVIPKKHVGYVFSLHENEYLNLLKASEKIAKALKKATKCKRVCLSIYGFEINHTHVHLTPLNNIDEMKHHIKKPSQKRQKDFVEKMKKIIK